MSNCLNCVNTTICCCGSSDSQLFRYVYHISLKCSFYIVTQQLKEDEIVQCYSSATDCTSNTNGVSLAAIDCCNRNGGGYISHPSLNAVAQCGACIGKITTEYTLYSGTCMLFQIEKYKM